jgi:hypothetical protein
MVRLARHVAPNKARGSASTPVEAKWNPGRFAPLTNRASEQGDAEMFGIIAAVLVVLWLLGFFAFHISSALIHLLLVVGLILLVVHFVSGRRAL